MAQAKKTTGTTKATSQGIRRVAVIGGNRIPFARSNTAYSKISNQELLTSALRGLVDRFNLDGMRMGEVVAGAVIKHSREIGRASCRKEWTALRFPKHKATKKARSI